MVADDQAQLTWMLLTAAAPMVPTPLTTVQVRPAGWVRMVTPYGAPSSTLPEA